MHIVCLLGSPRAEGNSTVMAEHFLSAAAVRGASVASHHLSALAFSGCRNLFACKTGADRCGLRDDLTPLLEDIRRADVLVLASPVYFTDVSSLLKAAIDRFFSFLVDDYVTAQVKSRLVGARRLVFVQSQGEPEASYAGLLERYAKSFRMLGFTDCHLIRACGIREPGAVKADQRIWTGVERDVARTLDAIFEA